MSVKLTLRETGRIGNEIQSSFTRGEVSGLPWGELSLLPLDVSRTGDQFTDERDGQTYRTVKMPDGKEWMAQNFSYEPSGGGWYNYNYDPAMGVQYGKLYDWATAQTIAPPGWHLPTREEWDDLAMACGGGSLCGGKLKSKDIDYTVTYTLTAESTGGQKAEKNVMVSVKGTYWPKYRGTDNYGFAALPGGIHYSSGEFGLINSLGYWWAASENGIGAGYNYRLSDGNNVLDKRTNTKLDAYSVRLVKN